MNLPYFFWWQKAPNPCKSNSLPTFLFFSYTIYLLTLLWAIETAPIGLQCVLSCHLEPFLMERLKLPSKFISHNLRCKLFELLRKTCDIETQHCVLPTLLFSLLIFSCRRRISCCMFLLLSLREQWAVPLPSALINGVHSICYIGILYSALHNDVWNLAAAGKITQY